MSTGEGKQTTIHDEWRVAWELAKEAAPGDISQQIRAFLLLLGWGSRELRDATRPFEDSAGSQIAPFIAALESNDAA